MDHNKYISCPETRIINMFRTQRVVKSNISTTPIVSVIKRPQALQSCTSVAKLTIIIIRLYERIIKLLPLHQHTNRPRKWISRGVTNYQSIANWFIPKGRCLSWRSNIATCSWAERVTTYKKRHVGISCGCFVMVSKKGVTYSCYEVPNNRTYKGVT